jgi:hypothetical protein
MSAAGNRDAWGVLGFLLYACPPEPLRSKDPKASRDLEGSKNHNNLQKIEVSHCPPASFIS